MYSRSGLNAVWKIKICYHFREKNPDSSAFQFHPSNSSEHSSSNNVSFSASTSSFLVLFSKTFPASTLCCSETVRGFNLILFYNFHKFYSVVYLRHDITNQNLIQEEIKSRLMLATIQFRTFYFSLQCLKT
jgi:hypothetical protein